MTIKAFDQLTKRLVLVVVLSLPCIWILLQIDIQRESSFIFVPRFQKDNSSQFGFLVDTIGCRIPDLDPFDRSIKQYIYSEPQIVCNLEVKNYHTVELSFVESNLTSLYINKSVLSTYNISDEDNFSCCYRPFWRAKSGHDSNVKAKYSKSCTRFKSEATIDAEFVKVECHLNSTQIYKDYHAFVPLKKNVEDRCNITHTKDTISVLVIGVDAVSRLNLHRQMPQTVSFLKNNLNVVNILGYNKVDDNTFPNLTPILSGLSVEELKKVCWPTSSSVFDDCPMIWKNYSASGYRTMYAEDASWMGTFIYAKQGFQKQPTDYYTRIFNKIAEEDIGHEKRLNANLCIGTRLSNQVLLNYASKFAVTMLDKLSFGFVWAASLSHDYLNLPKYGDERYVAFFTELLHLGVFNKTILIFLSDHGIRWGGIRETYQGYLEERLPFLWIAYPDWFKKKYVTAIGNLRKNARRLTTPFDLHETLKDFLNLETLGQAEIKNRSNYLNSLKTPPRGISLFLPISENRTCAKAGLAEHWCTCHQSMSVSTNNKNVIRSVEFLVAHINALLKPFPQCAELKLDKIVNARLEKPTAHLAINTTDAGMQDYSVTIETTPGNALFEATVRYDANRRTYSLAGAISRINLYGNQSVCVLHFRMKLYCYCRNQL